MIRRQRVEIKTNIQSGSFIHELTGVGRYNRRRNSSQALAAQMKMASSCFSEQSLLRLLRVKATRISGLVSALKSSEVVESCEILNEEL